MKNILHLIETSGPGGAEKMLINLVESLEPASYTSLIGLMKDGWLRRVLSDLGYETLILPHTRSIDFEFVRNLISVIKGKNIDLMHAHEFAMNTLGSLASLTTRVPIVATVHGKNYYGEKWRRRLAYRWVSRQSRMVAVSEDIAEFLAHEIGISRRNIMTIHNGIRTDLFLNDDSARARYRSLFRLNEGQPLIGTVGSLYPVKGHTYLLNALAIVKRSVKDVKAVIVGRGFLLDQLIAEATSLGLGGDVEFLGFREDIPMLIQAMDIFVLPSLSEGHPLALLEAMASQKPVVATDVGGLREVVQDGKVGILVPRKDPQALAEKIIMLIKNKELAQEMAIAGRIRSVNVFDIKNTVKKYTDIYNQL
jgi:glycosyltransferase involved in cell wall biosynthesis